MLNKPTRDKYVDARPSYRRMSPGKLIEIFTDKFDDHKNSLLDFKAEAILMTGKEKHNDKEIKTLYVGSLSNYDFILQKIYGQYEVLKEDHIKIWRSGKSAEDSEKLADLVVLDIPWPYHFFIHRDKFIESPAWVCQRIDLTREWNEIERCFSNEAKTEDYRKIRKYGLVYEITNEASDIEFFYDKMYRPYLSKRYGDLASYEPYGKIYHFASKGKLLQIKRDKSIVAAAVLYECNSCMHFLWTGTQVDPKSSMGRGAFSALYYYSIFYAFEAGCNLIDFEGTRPILNDGVFMFKRKWGSIVCDGWSLDTFLFQPRRFTPAVISFFKNTPLVARKGKKLNGKVLFDQEGNSCTSKDLDTMSKRYGGSGLTRLEIAATGGYSQDASEYAKSTKQALSFIDLSRAENSTEKMFIGKG